MRKIFVCLGIVLSAILSPSTSHAQLFKNLVNNAMSKAGARPGYDSAALARMRANSNRSKPSISPADSAAAIKQFMTATGGSGLFYQYRNVYTFKIGSKDSTSRDSTSLAITDGHNIRSDMDMMGSKMEVIGHAGLPRYSVSLYPDRKTYVFHIIDTTAVNSRGVASYQVTKVGNETVGGYACIHSRMTIGTAGQRAGVVEDIWTSVAVPGYGTLEKLMNIQNVTPAMVRALEQAGCGGFFVRVQMQSKAFSMDMQLVTADRRNFPASMFEIPQGYKMGNGM